MSNVRLAEEVEPNPPPDLDDFEDEAPPPVSRTRAFLGHAAVKFGGTIGVTVLALGYLVLKGPFAAPPAPSQPEVALATAPAPAPAPPPAPSPTPVVAAPPLATEAAPPPAPANPIDALAAQGVDPSPTGAITPPKKHKHKPKKPKPTPTPAPT